MQQGAQSYEASFSDFVRARWSATVRLANGLTLDAGRAEDLAQDAFAKLWPHWPRLRDDNPAAYLRRVVVTTFLSSRRLRRVSEHLTDAPPELPHRDGNDELDGRDALRQVLLRLSPRQRAVVYLRYAEDLPEAQVAELLGCSVGSVKTHASRALAALRLTVPPEHYDRASTPTHKEVRDG